MGLGSASAGDPVPGAKRKATGDVQREVQRRGAAEYNIGTPGKGGRGEGDGGADVSIGNLDTEKGGWAEGMTAEEYNREQKRIGVYI